MSDRNVGRSKIMKRSWTEDEDILLQHLVDVHGTANWCVIGDGLEGRTGKQCRERWHNHLQDGIKKGEWTEEEDRVIMEMQAKIGNQWAAITKMLPGRSDNAVKNRWHATNRLQMRIGGPSSSDADAAYIFGGSKRPSLANHFQEPLNKQREQSEGRHPLEGRRHPLVPVLSLSSIVGNPSPAPYTSGPPVCALAPSSLRVFSSADLRNQQTLDLLHGHDHSHDHCPLSGRSHVYRYDGSSSSRFCPGSGRMQYYHQSLSQSTIMLHASPRDSVEGSPRIDLLAVDGMDDSYINSCLPQSLPTSGRNGDSARDVLMDFSPRGGWDDGRMGVRHESSIFASQKPSCGTILKNDHVRSRGLNADLFEDGLLFADIGLSLSLIDECCNDALELCDDETGREGSIEGVALSTDLSSTLGSTFGSVTTSEATYASSYDPLEDDYELLVMLHDTPRSPISLSAKRARQLSPRWI